MNTSLRQEYAEKTRQTLIDTARTAFIEHGYDAAALDVIVEQAGMTKGALYHHFKGGKKKLFEAVFIDMCQTMMRVVLEKSTYGATLWDKFTLGTFAYLDYCLQPDYRRVVLVDGRAVLDFETWCQIDAQYIARPVRITIKRLIEAGLIAPQPIELLIRAYLGLLQETAFYIIAAEDTAQARTEADQLIERFLQALR